MADTPESAPTTPPPRRWRRVYSLVQRGKHTIWLRMGIAYMNPDGSADIILDAVPLSGRLRINAQSESEKPSALEVHMGSCDQCVPDVPCDLGRLLSLSIGG